VEVRLSKGDMEVNAGICRFLFEIQKTPIFFGNIVGVRRLKNSGGDRLGVLIRSNILGF
jgi:hypothetical protein